MPQRARALHDEWKAADLHAHDIELRLKQQWDRYFAGRGDPPDDALVRAAAEARQVSSDKLALLVEYMQSVSAGRAR
jgi:hypothetical protein